MPAGQLPKSERFHKNTASWMEAVSISTMVILFEQSLTNRKGLKRRSGIF